MTDTPNPAFRWRALTWVGALLVLGLAGISVAGWVRYGLIEPEPVAKFCAATAHALSWRCQLRDGTIFLLTDQRLGWFAVALAVVSFLCRHNRLCYLAWLGWWVASMAFVLYNAELAAPALLLSGAALACWHAE